MAKLVHQVVTTYQDKSGNVSGVCTCGKTYPLEAGGQTGVTTLAMHISLSNRNEAFNF